MIFPSFDRHLTEENTPQVELLKRRAFSAWLKHAKLTSKKYSTEAIDQILPSNSLPISIGQLSLSTYLKKHGIGVKYIHCDYLKHEKMLSNEELTEYIIRETASSEYVGIYSMTPTINCALEILENVKKNHPNTITIIGGPHATYMDTELIEGYPFIDIVSRGEGENTLLSIINSYGRSRSAYAGIPGITYRDGNLTIRNKDQVLLPSDEIPDPDYDLLPKSTKLLCTVMYARGCPYSCRFCAEGGMWRHIVRFRDPKKVAQEIYDINKKRGQIVIHIADSEIDAVPSKLEMLLDEIIALDLDCRFTVNLRCDAYKRLTVDLVKKMKQAGVFGYLIGVESAYDPMLEIMGRKSRFEDFLKTIDLLNENDAGYILPGIMLCFPGETEYSFEYTKRTFLKLLEDGRVSYFFPKIFVPYPGTEPFSNPQKYNLSVSNDWDNYNRYDTKSIIRSETVSPEYISASLIDFYEKIVAVLEGFVAQNG